MYRIYLQEIKGLPGRDFGLDYVPLSVAQAVKHRFQKSWPSFTYYIRKVR